MALADRFAGKETGPKTWTVRMSSRDFEDFNELSKVDDNGYPDPQTIMHMRRSISVLGLKQFAYVDKMGNFAWRDNFSRTVELDEISSAKGKRVTIFTFIEHPKVLDVTSTNQFTATAGPAPRDLRSFRSRS